MFKDVRFYPILNLAIFGLHSPSTFHNVKNHRGGDAEGEPARIARERRAKEK